MRNLFKRVSTICAAIAMLLGIGIASGNNHVAKAAVTYELITSNSALNDDDKVVLGTADDAYGVNGWNGSKDATVDATKNKDNWVKYVIKKVTGGFTLFDADQNKYVVNPSSTDFKYNASSKNGTCSVEDKTGVLMCGNRYLAKDGTAERYRFYTDYSSRIPFYVYKVVEGPSAILMNSIKFSVDGQDVTNKELNLNKEAMIELAVEYAPTDVTNSQINWTSSDDAVAEYSEGVIYTYKAGEATITATAADGGGATASITVHVTEPGAPQLTGVTVSGTPATQYIGAAFNYSGLTFTPVYDITNPTPEAITGDKIEWPAVEAGMTSITGTYKGFDVVVNGLTVVEDSVELIIITGDMLDKVYYTNEEFNVDGLKVEALFKSGVEKDVTSEATWTFSKTPATLEVGTDQSVDVTASYGGKSYTETISGITIAPAPVVASAMFDFTDEANRGTLNPKKLSEENGAQTRNNITISVAQNGGTAPADFFKPIRLYPNNKLIITGNDIVSSITSIDFVANTTGYATALKNSMSSLGTITVDGKNVNATFTTEVKSIEIVCTTQVRLDTMNVNYIANVDPNQKVESITINPSFFTLVEGTTAKLNAIVLPANAGNSSVTWATDNSEVITVDSAGNITAVAVGEATITATAKDGSNVVGSCKVIVNPTPIIDFTAQGALETATSCQVKEGVNLTITQTGSSSQGYDSNSTTDRGIQFSSGSNHVNVKLDTADHKFAASAAPLNVVVNASTTSDYDGKATLKVFVGYTQIGETVKLTKSAADYVFVAPKEASGRLRIELDNNGTVYFKSLKVYGTMEEQTADDKAVYALADKIVGLDTCKDFGQATTLREEYNKLTPEAQKAFNAIVVQELDEHNQMANVTLGDKLAYMEYMQTIKTTTPSSTQNVLLNTTTGSASLILVIGLMGVVSIAGYYLLNKKRLYR